MVTPSSVLPSPEGVVTLARTERVDLVLVGGTLYASPTDTARVDSTVVLRGGTIVQVGPSGRIELPRHVRTVDCAGKVLVAGFWNSHVHFTDDAWASALDAPAPGLNRHLKAMLTRWGFTSVFDLGSSPWDTLALRARVEQGELLGPAIRTTGIPIYPQGGVPSYLPESAARQLASNEASNPEQAARLAHLALARGADGIKVFAGGIRHGRVVPMPADVVRAATTVAHAAGKPVFAHPSNHDGTNAALAGGADVLAHTIPMEESFAPEQLKAARARSVALTPTLSLFPDEERKAGGTAEDGRRVLERATGELRDYFAHGGPVLFGTDVGYTSLYDPADEYASMASAGLSWREILASLTTLPSAFFGARSLGRVEAGMGADLVVLTADPAEDVRNLSRVACTIRDGRILYAADAGENPGESS